MASVENQIPKLPTPENKLCPDCFWCGTVFNMIFVFWEECTRKAVSWKLPQISRLAWKSLLCNVSMNTCLDDRASRAGSVISVGTLPLRRTTQWCITLQKTQRKHQRVRKCPLKYLNPPWGEYGKTRSSNIETAKQSDFPQAVSDKAISRHSFGYSDP